MEQKCHVRVRTGIQNAGTIFYKWWPCGENIQNKITIPLNIFQLILHIFSIKFLDHDVSSFPMSDASSAYDTYKKNSVNTNKIIIAIMFVEVHDIDCAVCIPVLIG